MTGRLFGPTTLPPNDPAEWDLKPRLIYGCTLCHRLQEPKKAKRQRLYELRGGEIANVDYRFNFMDYHGPSFDVTTVKETDPISLCVSMGHIYYRKVDLSTVNLARYKTFKADKITIVNEDLPYKALILHEGQFYNLSAAVLLDVVAEKTLINLAKAHHKMVNAKQDAQTYQSLRFDFIKLLDEYLAPPSIKLDTQYGLNAVKFLIRHIDFQNNRGLLMDRIPIKSAMGKVYRTKITNDDIVLKYQLLDDDGAVYIWDLERQNGELINRNLDHQASLPYPYTYHAFRCAEMADLENLQSPSCPLNGQNKVGVFVQAYVDSVGSIHKYTTANASSSGLPMYIESMATLAEAHQGSTVEHHFMHLDAHGGNFLVSTCDENVRICGQSHKRVSDFGGYTFQFGTLGHRVYLIDFGFSHFLENKRDWVINSDLDNTPLGSELLPAYDFITLQRGTLASLLTNFAKWYNAAEPSVKDEHANLRLSMTRVLQLSSMMVAEQIIALLKQRLARGHELHPLDTHDAVGIAEDPEQQMYSDLDLETVSQNLLDVYQKRESLEDAQLFLFDYADTLMTYLLDVPHHLIKRTDYDELTTLLCGMYDYKYQNDKVLDRRLYQRQLNQLPVSVVEKLQMNDSAVALSKKLSGIPLYLWYVNNYAMRLPILSNVTDQ